MSREYESNPRPEVEQHYHIRELIDRQEKRTADRNYHREQAKEMGEREALIADAKPVCLTDFWCSDCQKDFKSVAIKQVEIDWSNTKQNIAFYKTKCFCGKWAIRFITDKNRDGYWVRSRAVGADRGKFHNDLIQPHQSGFNLLFGKK